MSSPALLSTSAGRARGPHPPTRRPPTVRCTTTISPSPQRLGPSASPARPSGAPSRWRSGPGHGTLVSLRERRTPHLMLTQSCPTYGVHLSFHWGLRLSRRPPDLSPRKDPAPQQLPSSQLHLPVCGEAEELPSLPHQGHLPPTETETAVLQPDDVSPSLPEG